jgi:hypothetical protein
MLLRGGDIKCFSTPIVLQAMKACRYTTAELKAALLKQRESNQLPLTYDLINSVRDHYWKMESGCVSPQERYMCGLYLCLELGFDTGQRISNLTHRRSLSHEDHCIRTGHISFVFSPSNLYPGTPMLKAGPSLRGFMSKHNPPFTSVHHMTLLFLTQKSGAVYQAKLGKPIIIGRSNPIESNFLDRMLLWCILNWNDEEDELFTRRIRNGKKKRLLPCDVTKAIKFIATSNGFQPERFGTHSLRRGYATISEYYHRGITLPSDPATNRRAGWSADSKCRTVVYSRANCNGALSYDQSLLTADHVREIAGSAGRVGSEPVTRLVAKGGY